MKSTGLGRLPKASTIGVGVALALVLSLYTFFHAHHLSRIIIERRNDAFLTSRSVHYQLSLDSSHSSQPHPLTPCGTQHIPGASSTSGRVTFRNADANATFTELSAAHRPRHPQLWYTPSQSKLIRRKDATSASGEWNILDSIPEGSIISLTFTNGHYCTLLTNWVMHARLLGVHYVVAVFDQKAADFCQEHGIIWVWAHVHLRAENFRKDLTAFRQMGSMKPRLVADLLQLKRPSAVVLSDTDTSWLRHPQELLHMHPTADIMISTDCLSRQAEVQGTLNHNRCGHTLGSWYGMTWNTGVIVFRNTEATKKVVDTWHAELSNQEKSLTVLDANGKPTGLTLTDQMELNMILNRDVLVKPLVASAADPALLKGMVSGLPFSLLPLSVLQAASGHTYFLQHLPQEAGVAPFVVHATFQRHGIGAKVERFREEGIWIEEDASYHTTGKFMTYRNEVVKYIAAEEALWQQRHGRSMAWHHKHMLAAAYQIGALQDAFAFATVLQRVLILPEFVCYCDQDHYPNIMENCTVSGSDLSLPFACPADVFIMTDLLDAQYTTTHPHRLKSFLNSPEVPDSLLASAADVVLTPHFQQSTAATRNQLAVPVTLDATGQVVVPQGFKNAVLVPMHSRDTGVKGALQGAVDAGILHFFNLVPGSFGGFESVADAKSFDGFFSRITGGVGWCCSGGQYETQWEYVYWRYHRPEPVLYRSGDASDAVLPKMLRPTMCDDRKLTAENEKYVVLRNHPCNYLPRIGA